MPEGDTIFRAARTLSAVLTGQTVLRVESTVPALSVARTHLVGARVEAVEARGKNLLMRFDDGRVLHTHMRMHGSWHVYRHGERWQRARHRARIVLEVKEFVVVCFDAPVVELMSPSRAETKPALALLGPDILSPEFDADEARRRLRMLDGSPLGDAVLDQRAVAGIGNVYKSELLFVMRLDPFAAVSAFDDTTLDRLLVATRRLMQHNSKPEQRMRTVRRDAPGGRFYVYGRSGKPCYVCSTMVRMERQGIAARSTYFCSRCQHVDTQRTPARPSAR
jgi:endonuclease-8